MAKRKADRPLRVARLRTVGEVVAELGRIYRAARRGEISPADGCRLTMMLREIRAALESADLERRVEALEADAARARGGWS